MAFKKRKVTFDPEELPSCESEPVDLLYADYPPVLSHQDSADIICPSSPSKSILKNPPVGDRGYENLCNILFDLPPPPEHNLLSIDNIFQTETVFKPGNNFAKLKLESIKALEQKFEKVEEEEEENEEENLADVYDDKNNNELDNYIPDPLFDESIVDLSADGSSDWLSEVSELSTESPANIPDTPNKIQVNESEVIDNVPQDVFHIEDFSLQSDLIVGETQEVQSDEISLDISINESENLIDQLSRENSFEDSPNPNIRKLDDTSIEELTEAEIKHKKNKSLERNLSSQLTLNSATEFVNDTNNPTLIEFHNTEGFNDCISTSNSVFYTQSEPQDVSGKAECISAVDALSLTNLSSLIDASDSTKYLVPEAPEEFLESKTFIKGSYSVDSSELQRHTSVEAQIRHISSDADLEKFKSSDIEVNQSTTVFKHKKKSDKKSHNHHRKHSHSKKSKHKKQEVPSSPHVVHLEATEKRSAEARARFQRYLNKMAAKSENVNLNCAGETETLEPHMRDSIKESDVLIWIYNMIDEVARVDYEFFLKDGCILCKLMNRIVPGSIQEISRDEARSKQKNVANFLRAAEAYGVAKAKLFFPEDLLQLRHVPRVTRCLYALAKQVREDSSMDPDTPKLGDEPSFLQNQQKPVVIPGHRDTKDILGQLTAKTDVDASDKKTKHSLLR